MKLTINALVAAGVAAGVATVWLDPMQAATDKFKVSETPERLAAFLANVGVESAGLTRLSENMNYSAARLAVVWPFRYAQDSHVAHKVPNDIANRIGGHPERVANNVYANRMGNGPEASGDGWKFRGHGPIGLTGREATLKFFEACELDQETDPETLNDPALGSESAAWFFATKPGMFEAADEGDFDATVKLTNGQPPCDTNHGDLRRERYATILAELKPAPKGDGKKA